MTTDLRRRFHGIAAALVAAVVVADAAACQICLPMPAGSLADRILAAEHLVLAREAPEAPFTLAPVRRLHGGGSLPEMDLFLDASTRGSLSRDGGLAILCDWSAGHGWRRTEVHDPVLAPVVATILASREKWRDAPDDRPADLSGFLTHADPRLRELAHIEVARSPYGRLQRYAGSIPRETLLAGLDDHRRVEWHALYILLLAHTGNPADAGRIRRGMADAAAYGFTSNLAAWTTAYLEIDGGDALRHLETWYGAGPTRAPGERAAVLAALVVHGNEGDPALRDPITGVFGTLLRAEPALAPAIATALTDWRRDDLAPHVAALLRDSPETFDPAATTILRRYVLSTRSDARPPETSRVAPALSAVALAGLAVALGVRRRPRVTPLDGWRAARNDRNTATES